MCRIVPLGCMAPGLKLSKSSGKKGREIVAGLLQQLPIFGAELL